MSEPLTLAERYSLAISASRLSPPESRRLGNVDMLIAAGWCPETLGTMLYRLAAEYDQVRTQLRGHAGNDKTERLMVLMRLKSLDPVKQKLGAWAQVQATRRKFLHPDKVVSALVGNALRVFLDPACHTCTGIGTAGGYDGKPLAVCRTCGGTGKGFLALGTTDEEREFSHYLLSEIERMASSVEPTMRRFLANS